MYLGNSQLSLDTLSQYKTDLETWFSSSYPTARTPSLQLYGCNVAMGDGGAEFINKLRTFTSSNVYASTTKLGNAALGGRGDAFKISSIVLRLKTRYKK